MLSQKIVEFEENNKQPCARAQRSGRIVLGILLGWMLDPKRLVAFSNSIWSTGDAWYTPLISWAIVAVEGRTVEAK